LNELFQFLFFNQILDHPYFVCSQFHPEFLTRPLLPAPLFLGFILASLGELNEHFGKSNSMETYKWYESNANSSTSSDSEQ